MARLEDLKPGLKVRGIVPRQDVSVVDVKWHGSTAVELFYKRADGRTGTQLLFRDDESSLDIVQARRTWSFNADGGTFRLVAEAYRIHLAHLFDHEVLLKAVKDGVKRLDAPFAYATGKSKEGFHTGPVPPSWAASTSTTQAFSCIRSTW